MEYCILKGFLAIMLIQHCTSEGVSTSIQSSTVVARQDGQTISQDPELPPAEVVPVVSPPSLKEVQQAVQEASEQVEGRGAEEVLKELLERVVEAALGQAEGGSEAKTDAAEVQETVKEDVLGAESEADTEAEVLERAVEEENVVDTGVGEMPEVAELDAFEDVAKEGRGVVAGEIETPGGSEEKSTAHVEPAVREAEGVEVIDESPGTEFGEEVVGGAVAPSEETGGDLAVDEAVEEDTEEQVMLSEDKGAVETEIQGAEETPAVVDMAVGGEPEQEIVDESEPGLGVDDGQQIGHDWGKEAPGEETQEDKMENEASELPSDNVQIETSQSVEGELVEEKEEVNIVKDPEGPEAEDEQGHLVEGGAAEGVDAKGTYVGEADERHGDSVIKEESVALVSEGDKQKAEEEEQIALVTTHSSQKDDQDVLVISGPEPEDGAEASIDQSPENQAPTPNPSLSMGEAGENTLSDEKPNHGNEITPTNDLLQHNPAVARPTLDHFMNDVLAENRQAEGETPGKANEIVEDRTGSTATNELGLQAWKIGAISAAVFLVLETIVITIYIHKCRNKNRTPALQRACEEGCVEPEAATGGDCSDDTLPAGNGQTQQIAALDSSNVASTKAKKQEQHQNENAIAMSDLPPTSTEESANTGPGPDSSPDLRTSIL